MLFIAEIQLLSAAYKTVHKSSVVVHKNVDKYQLHTQLYTNAVPVCNGYSIVLVMPNEPCKNSDDYRFHYHG